MALFLGDGTRHTLHNSLCKDKIPATNGFVKITLQMVLMCVELPNATSGEVDTLKFRWWLY